jgi:signal transduction histidine kinase
MFTKEEKQKLKELIDSNEDFAYFINKALKEYELRTSQISHELRNPLTLIKSTSQLIESTHPEVGDIKYWGQLKEDINEMELLLTEYSNFNHSEVISKQDTNFLLLLKSVLNNFRPLAEQSGIELSLTIADNDIPYYTSYSLDPVKIKQVFHNLIRNAFEATKKGNFINVECTVLEPSHLTIGVHNNGEEIPTEILPTIFHPFVTHKSGGSGLGLAISSNVILAHDGTLNVNSSREKTSFIIHLPLAG